MESLAGQTVSHYVFLEKLGSGGMGEIYKARDSRLNRVVAIKVLEPSKTRDPERRRRFIQEAQAASALNHPSIITIFDILPEGDTQYMVMEYVQGRTLHEMISEGRLPIPQVLQLAAQMASALSAAHAAGIIHRDFKPANVMVTGSGLVKVLDFGLAKLQPAMHPDEEQKTLTAAPLTREGVIMGTVNYMSPEQAEGLKVDGRSDMFSFGAVLYEMITGQRAFAGDSGISTLSAVLRDEVKPIQQIVPDAPEVLVDVVSRCLRKSPAARLESMMDVETALEVLKRRFEAEVVHRASVSSQTAPASAPAAAVFTPVTGLQRQNPPRKTAVLKLVSLGVAGVAVIALAVFLARWSMRPKPLPVATTAPAPVSSNSPAVSNPEPAPTPAPVVTEPPTEAAPPPPTPSTPKIEKAPPAPKAVIPPPIATVAPSAPAIHSAAPSVVVPIQLNDGLPFRIALLDDVPITAEVGRLLRFRVLDGVRSGETTVIAKGSIVTGSLVDLGGKRKFFGERSKVRFQLIAADSVDDAKISIRATPAPRADGDETRPFATPNAAKDKNLIAASGTQYVAYISGDQTVSVHQ